jgi:hypothetical protein
VARVIRFDPNYHPPDLPWDRFPRFDEVGAHIDAQAARMLDSKTSLAIGSELYARLEARLAPEDRPLLRELYEAICSHQEHYERAAYLVGLRAATGRLEGLPAMLKDDRRRLDDDPEPA